MKTISKKVAIASDQVADEFVERFKVDRSKDRYSVELGEVSVQIPENTTDVQTLLQSTRPTAVIDALSRQLVTDAANAFRKAFTKAGEGAQKTAHREEVRRWLLSPTGQQFQKDYVALPNDAKVVNAWLDAKYEEFFTEEA